MRALSETVSVHTTINRRAVNCRMQQRPQTEREMVMKKKKKKRGRGGTGGGEGGKTERAHTLFVWPEAKYFRELWRF